MLEDVCDLKMLHINFYTELIVVRTYCFTVINFSTLKQIRTTVTLLLISCVESYLSKTLP